MQIRNAYAEINTYGEGSFIHLAKLNGHHFATVKITGASPVWEMHPDTEELFFVLEGSMEITLLEEAGAKTYKAVKGDTFSIPKKIWHKPSAPNGVTILYYTPGTTMHSDAADPREQPVK